MDPTTAQSLLKELFSCLPTEYWWLLHQKDEDDNGLAKAFDRPRAESDALLVNSGICKENGHGFTFVLRNWENFCSTLQTPIVRGNICKVLFIANIEPPDFDSPSKQLKGKGRRVCCAQLPDDLIESLRKSAEHYDRGRVKSANQQMQSARLAKIQSDAATKRDRETLLKTLQYPLVSKIVGGGEDINLGNETVKEWARMALLEIIRLHDDVGEEISFTAVNGRQ